jgi:hypothetical protein
VIGVFFFQLIFDGKISEPNTTVAIANVLVTTETCLGHGTAYPYFADPGNKLLPRVVSPVSLKFIWNLRLHHCNVNFNTVM